MVSGVQTQTEDKPPQSLITFIKMGKILRRNMQVRTVPTLIHSGSGRKSLSKRGYFLGCATKSVYVVNVEIFQ
jgi:hypothetical protein